jgi:hypothetical protein
MTPIHISAAIFMVGVSVAILVWLRGSEAAASARRLTGMMRRVGLDPATAMLGDPRTRAVMKESRRRCGNCPREDLCDRWLAGEVEGGNAFCRNARTFRLLRGT